jgi:hypothetical protein
MDPLPIFAYQTKEPEGFVIVPAPANRPWMDATNQQFAKRCLPMLIGNQAGWFILNGKTFRATWDGGSKADGIRLKFDGEEKCDIVRSHFGEGILTFTIPYLFRTPEGYNLLARGPANSPKDGISPLEGLVETDWSCATFTMNWKFTRPNHTVEFQVGEPICMIVPQKRGELETFVPEMKKLSDEPELNDGYQQWKFSRLAFQYSLKLMDTATVKRGWQKDYFQGRDTEGNSAARHQTKLNLRDFKIHDSDVDLAEAE